MQLQANDRFYNRLILVVSIAIPLVVALLLQVRLDVGLEQHFLPLLNACINSAVTVLLIAGYVFIRQKNIARHRAAMLAATVLSALFLISYVIHHATSDSTKFGGEGTIRYIYFFILVSHILLAMAIVPLALLSVYRGLSMQVVKHRRIAKWTLPIWLYVSITGVAVYLMISPYYGT